MDTDPASRNTNAARRLRSALVLVGALAVGAAGAAALFARELRRTRDELRDAQSLQLAASSRDHWDSHPDADLGRVLQPRLGGEGSSHSNRFGLSEAEFELPKPKGAVRVVLLGDSFVHGMGVEQHERLGVHLQRWLSENARKKAAAVEVLHIGLPSWNIRAECAYLRRSLSLLEPDLVVHVLVCNDLDDTASVRGFGVMANFTSQHRTRANALTDSELPLRLGGTKPGLLPYGLDHESRSRYAAARADLERLESAVRAAGAEYLLVFNWAYSLSVAHEQLGQGRDARGVLYLSDAFASDPRYRLSEGDSHWSITGHLEVASVLYGAISERGLLPALDPAPVPQHARAFEERAAEGLRSIQSADAFRDPYLAALSPRLRLPIDDDTPLEQVLAGLERSGHVAPYFAATLAPKGGRTLRLRGSSLERRELEGARLEVAVDDAVLGTVALRADQPIDASFELPAELAQRPAVTVRLVGSDYVYLKDLRRCSTFVLRELAIER